MITIDIKLEGLEDPKVGDEVEILRKDGEEVFVKPRQKKYTIKKGKIIKVNPKDFFVQFDNYPEYLTPVDGHVFSKKGTTQCTDFRRCILRKVKIDSFGLTYSYDKDLTGKTTPQLYSFTYNMKEVPFLTESFPLQKRVYTDTGKTGTIVERRNRDLGIHLDGEPAGKTVYFPMRHVYLANNEPIPEYRSLLENE